MRQSARAGTVVPIPLVVVFGLFVVAIGYLVAASLTRRSAPAYAVTPANRTRPANWEQVGDTLTVDASDGDRWTYVSLSKGRVLNPPDTAAWELAVQRYRIRARGVVIDLGPTSFEHPTAHLVRFTGALMPSGAPATEMPFGHWYRYNMLTHLLEPTGSVYETMIPAEAKSWKVAILSYYCPGLVAGCLTIRYAPIHTNRYRATP